MVKEKRRLIKHFILLHQNCCVDGVVLFYLLYILLMGLNKVPQKKTLRKELVQKGFVKKMLPKKTSKKKG